MISKANLLAFACALAAIAALLASLHAGHPAQAHLAHSDALYLPVCSTTCSRAAAAWSTGT